MFMLGDHTCGPLYSVHDNPDGVPAHTLTPYVILHFLVPIANRPPGAAEGRNTLDRIEYRHACSIPEVAATINGMWVPAKSISDFCFVFNPFDLKEAKYQCRGVANSFMMWQSLTWSETKEE